MLWFMSIVIVVTVSATSEKVWLREVNTKQGQSPYRKQYDLTHSAGTTRLRLQENRRVNPNAPVFEATIGDDGIQRLVQKTDVPRMTTRFFHDRENDGAFMMVYDDKTKRLVLTGGLRVGDHWYHLSPAPTSADDPLSDDGSALYILEKQTANVTDDKVQNAGNDARDLPASNETEGNLFDDGHLPPGVMKKTPLSEKQRRKIKRRLSRKKRSSQSYGVELLIVVDHSLWLWERFDDAEDPSDEAREKKIREYFAHIVSGMSLRYENIEDPELNMYVTLSAFIIYKQRDSTNPLPLTAEIIEIDEYKLVDGVEYLYAIVDWTADLPSNITADHTSVYTGYDMYHNTTDVNGRSMSGVSFNKGMCITGYSVSLMEASAFYTTVSVASHEVGHSLGAYHDGQDAAINCPGADKYIMREFTTFFQKDHAYTQNPWTFSSCSIQGFKNLTKSGQADCLLNRGDYYDRTEYESHLERLPGELRTPDEQCQQLFGVQSWMCTQYSLKTDATFCLTMACYKPTDGKCYYIPPAWGTHCGQPDTNTWCIEGQCVAKTDEHPQGMNTATEPSTTSTTRGMITATEPSTTSTTTVAQECTDVGYADASVNWDCQTLADYFWYYQTIMPSDWCSGYISNCCDFCSNAESTYTAPECEDAGYVQGTQYWSCQQLSDYFSGIGYAPAQWCYDLRYKDA